MCGRYSLTSALDALLPRLKGERPAGLEEHYAPRPQVRPGEPVLLQRQEHGRLAVGLALWGLVPDWARDPLAPGPDGRRRSRPINARSETVAEKPFFRGPWRHRRALIPADGFYEWQSRTDPASGKVWKQLWLFRRRDRAPFWLGGLWERWCGADGGELETAVILTTAPNDLLRRVHDRMPVLIPDGLEEPWLLASTGAELRALELLLAPWDPAAWEMVKIKSGTLLPAGPAQGEPLPDGGTDRIAAPSPPSRNPTLPSQGVGGSAVLGASTASSQLPAAGSGMVPASGTRPEGALPAVQLHLLERPCE